MLCNCVLNMMKKTISKLKSQLPKPNNVVLLLNAKLSSKEVVVFFRFGSDVRVSTYIEYL